MKPALTPDQIPSEPLPTDSHGTRPFQRACRIDQDVLELRPPPLGLLVSGWACVIGGAVAAVYLWRYTGADRMFALAPLGLCGGGVGILGGCFVARWLGTWVRVDRRAETITVTGFRFSPAVTLATGNVGGIQLCYAGRKHVGDNSFATRLYQLNLVLRRETVERFHLLECGSQKSMRKLAQALADFLDVPLLEQGC